MLAVAYPLTVTPLSAFRASQHPASRQGALAEGGAKELPAHTIKTKLTVRMDAELPGTD